MPTPRRLRPEQVIEAAAYLRVSKKSQAEGYSPETQRAALARLADQEGYALTMIEEDHESGTRITRAGYQRILEAVRAGRVQAVLVFAFDRFGREGGEWITRARELEQLGVPLISAQEGKDEPGIIRFVRAGLAEQFSRDLAKKVRPGREAAARAGKHLGPTPYGYQRVYPPYLGNGRRPSGQLVPDPATAWVVRELFERYDTGGVSISALLDWLLSDPRIPPRPDRALWSRSHIRGMLHRVTYAGAVKYNETPRGLYERAAQGAEFVVWEAHEPIVSRELWERVQRAMYQGATQPSRRRPKLTGGLATGLLRCSSCGGPMGYHLGKLGSPTRYECVSAKNLHTCHERGVRASVVHAALLAEVSRLRGAPWSAAVEARLARASSGARDEQTRLERALASEEEALRAHARAARLLGDDPPAEMVAAWRRESEEISSRIRALQAAKAALREAAPRTEDMRAFHARLVQTEIGGAVSRALAAGLAGELRVLLGEIVASARVVERLPAGRYTQLRWVRLSVTWTDVVTEFLAARALTLAPPEQPPHIPTEREMKRARDRRRSARRRAARAAAPGVPE